jgi:drug/metabolite transporter (DMT)-like permease
MLAAFATTVLFSISAVCAQRTTRALGGIEANFWRIIVATLILAAWAHSVGQGFSGTALPWFLLSGLIGFGLGDLALYQALPRVGSRLSILIMHCVAAPVAAATEWIWLGTRMTALQIGAAGLVLVGVALAIAPGRHLNITRRTFWIGISAAVLGAIGQAYGAVLSRVAYNSASRAGESIDGMTAAYQRIVAGVALAAIAFAIVRTRKASRDAERVVAGEDVRHSGTRQRIWPWVLMNAFAGPAVGVGFYQWALKERGTGIVLPIVALTPLVIIPFSRYVEGERPRKRSLLGGIVAVAGVFILAGGVDFLKRL